jgi:two-component system, response regulator PdtaR
VRHYLLVDDNRAFAENMAEIIRDLGDVVSVATSGADALGLVREQKFDAIVTDMRMPAMGGAELVHRTRQEDPGLPAIVVSAYTGDEDLRTARNQGLLAVLQKPVPMKQLLLLLERARRDGLVVLVEDDAGMVDNLSEALCDRGFTAVSAGSIAETEQLGQVHPFAAIVDLRVPGGADGDAMNRVAGRYPALPQIVITAHDPSAAPIKPRAVYRKPFDTRKLLAELESLYAEQRSTR